MEASYNLVLTGKIPLGFDESSCKAAAEKYLKLNGQQIDDLFDESNRLVIKKKLTHSTAVQYQQTLQKLGLHTVLQENELDNTKVAVVRPTKPIKQVNPTSPVTLVSSEDASTSNRRVINLLAYIICLIISDLLCLVSIILIPIGMLGGLIGSSGQAASTIEFAFNMFWIVMVLKWISTINRLNYLGLNGFLSFVFVWPPFDFVLLFLPPQQKNNQPRNHQPGQPENSIY